MITFELPVQMHMSLKSNRLSLAKFSSAMFVKIIHFYPLTAEQESLSEQSHHDHDYWSGASCLKAMHPIQDMLVDLNIFTLYTIVNVHCFDFTVSFVCFQLVLSMFCNLLYVSQLRAKQQQTRSRDPCEGWECLSDTGGLLEPGPSPNIWNQMSVY